MSTSQGKPLPPNLKARLERAFGTDLSDVRVIDGSMRPTIMGAKALAFGKQIHFCPGEYRPDKKSGQDLIAQEVAHSLAQQKDPKILPGQGGRIMAKMQVKKLLGKWKRAS